MKHLILILTAVCLLGLLPCALAEQFYPDDDGPWYYSVEESLPALLERELPEETLSLIDHPDIVIQLNEIMSVEIQEVLVTPEYASVGLKFHLDSDNARFVEDWEFYDLSAVENGQIMISLLCDAMINDSSDIHGYFYGFKNDGKDFYVQLSDTFSKSRMIDSSPAMISFRIQELKYDESPDIIRKVYTFDTSTIVTGE